jgi:hypothetical protein
LNEFIDVMRSYGEIDVTRSGSLAIGLENKKVRLQPPREVTDITATVGAGNIRPVPEKANA